MRHDTALRARIRSPFAATAALVALALTGCTSPAGSTQGQGREAVLQLSAGQIASGYADLATGTAALERAATVLCTSSGVATATALAEARAALRTARTQLAAVRPYGFGPAMSNAVADQLDHWPVLARPLAARISDGRTSGAQLDSAELGEIGLPALEQVLFDPQLAAAFGGTVVQRAHTCGYLRAASARVARLSATVAGEWEQFGPELAGGGRDSLTTVLTSMSQYIQLAEDGMLAVPAGLAGRDAAPETAHEGPAHLGVTNLRSGLASITDLYTGGDGAGLSRLVADRSAQTDAAVRASLAAAADRVAALPAPLRSTLVQDVPAVQSAVTALKQVQRMLTTDVAQLLGISVTVNNSDGD